jgi:protein phosphatase
LRKRGEQEWCEDTSDYRLAVSRGNRLSIVEETSRARLVKKDGSRLNIGRLKDRKGEKIRKVIDF